MTNEWLSPLYHSTIIINLTIFPSFSYLYSFKIMKKLVLSANYPNMSIIYSQWQPIFKYVLLSNNKWIFFTHLLFIYLILFDYCVIFYNCLQWRYQMDLSIRVEFSYHRHIYTICITLTIISLSNSKAIILIRTTFAYHDYIDSTFCYFYQFNFNKW